MDILYRVVAVAALFCAVGGCESKTEVEKASDVFIQAAQASSEGKTDEAIELYSKSIEVKPLPFSYLARAKLYLEKEDTESAIADCQAGLELDSEHKDLIWLLGESKKPAEKRFKGENASPPSHGK